MPRKQLELPPAVARRLVEDTFTPPKPGSKRTTRKAVAFVYPVIGADEESTGDERARQLRRRLLFRPILRI
jgi:hypothetical protein